MRTVTSSTSSIIWMMATEKDQEVDFQKVTEAFTALRRKAKELGIRDSQLSKISALKTLKKKRITCFVLTSVVFGLLGILCGVGLVLYRQEIITHESLYRFTQNIIDFDVEKDICLIPYPEIILDMFRPPVNCSICKDVHMVDKVDSLSKDEFVRKYAYTARPVVITDGTRDWSAPDYFSFSYFKSIYGPESPVFTEDQKCQFFPYKTNFQSLKDVFNMSEKDANMEGKPWYIGWSNCDSSAANELRKHYKIPYFIPDTSESSKTDWLFMGCPGYGAHLHIDAVGNPSWQAQIKGTKKWTLEPPPECAHVCDPKLEVTVYSGEIIVLDTNKWFHQTDIIGKELSITIGSEYD